MYKKHFLLAIFISIILTGCFQTPTSAPISTAISWPADKDAIVDSDGSVWHRYTDVPGVQFEYMDKFTGEKLFPLRLFSWTDTIKIAFVEFQNDGKLQDQGQTLEVFSKPANETIEQAIANIIKKNGKNPSQCKVEAVKDMPFVYRIFIAEPVAYTADELNQIALREKDYVTEQRGPETADYLKKSFDQEHLVELCTSYAEPAGLGTSSSYPGYFLYNSSINKTVFVYVPPQYDPLVYRNIIFTSN